VVAEIAFEPTTPLETETRALPPRRAPTRQLLVGGAAFACVVGAGAAILMLGREPGLQAVAAVAPAVSAIELPRPAASAPAAPSAEASAAEPADSAPAPSGKARSAGKPAKAPPAPPPAPAAPAAPARPDPCTPPYVVDGQGVKRIKKECAR
jgi:serine/threonine-protein kinase